MDREGYERIVRKHLDTVYRIAGSYTKTPADEEGEEESGSSEEPEPEQE